MSLRQDLVTACREKEACEGALRNSENLARLLTADKVQLETALKKIISLKAKIGEHDDGFVAWLAVKIAEEALGIDTSEGKT